MHQLDHKSSDSAAMSARADSIHSVAAQTNSGKLSQLQESSTVHQLQVLIGVIVLTLAVMNFSGQYMHSYG